MTKVEFCQGCDQVLGKETCLFQFQIAAGLVCTFNKIVEEASNGSATEVPSMIRTHSATVHKKIQERGCGLTQEQVEENIIIVGQRQEVASQDPDSSV